jgi:hypothetical protein
MFFPVCCLYQQKNSIFPVGAMLFLSVRQHAKLSLPPDRKRGQKLSRADSSPRAKKRNKICVRLNKKEKKKNFNLIPHADHTAQRCPSPSLRAAESHASPPLPRAARLPPRRRLPWRPSLPTSSPLPWLPLLPQDGTPSSRSRPVPQSCHRPKDPPSEEPVNMDLSPRSASEGARDEGGPAGGATMPLHVGRICGEPVTGCVFPPFFHSKTRSEV